jgi:hypothetical protein
LQAARPTTTSEKLVRFLPWIAGAVLILGAITLLQVLNRPEKDTASGTSGTQTQTVPQTVPPAPEARRAIARFVQTAVARKNLAEAWKISGPDIRGGLTYEQWLTGNIPVVPFDVDPRAESPAKLDWSYPNEASFQVLLLPRRGSSDKSTLFYIGVEKFGQRWLVNYWSSTPGPGPHEDPNR